MTKYRCVWLCILLFMLGIVYLMYQHREASHFGGLRLLAQEELLQTTEGKICLENPSEIGGILCLNGKDIAYDKASSTYYVPHCIDKKVFEAVFTASMSACDIYLEALPAWEQLAESVQEGHLFHVWFVAEHAYAVCNMIFTGAPIMMLNSMERVSYAYGVGELALFDPDDEEVAGLSIRVSDTLLKRNANSGTYSIKLMKKTLEEEKKLSLLGMGKNNNWKLYKVSENDGTLMRAMLASDVWNVINTDSNLQRKYQFVELVVNNQYQGLYLLTPKWTRAFLQADDNCLLHKAEDISNEELAVLWKFVDSMSLSRYALFLQITYAFKNTVEDYIILEQMMEDGKSGCILLPDKLEFAFGGFNDKLNYLSWNDTSDMLLSYTDMGIEENLWREEIFPLCSQNWKQLRLGELETVHFLKQVQMYKDYLVRSGLAKRCVREDMFGYYFDKLEQYITDRLEYLDAYFGEAAEGTQR